MFSVATDIVPYRPVVETEVEEDVNEASASITALPPELLILIFSYLDGLDLSSVRCVSKQFKGITNQPKLTVVRRTYLVNFIAIDFYMHLDPVNTSKTIQNQVIKDQRSLIRFARTAVESNAGALQYIDRFNIENRKVVTDLIDTAFRIHGRDVFDKDYFVWIDNAWVLRQIFKSAMAYDVEATMGYFRDFRIYNVYGWHITSDQQFITDLAIVAAKRDGKETSRCIENLPIESSETMAHVAGLAAMENGGGVAKYYERYRLPYGERTYQIAGMCADQDGRGTSKHIRHFGLREEGGKIGIATRAAGENGEGVSEFISNYGIKSRKALKMIAVTAIKNNPRGASKYIRNYGFKRKVLEELYRLALSIDIYVMKYRYNYVG